MDGTGRNAIYVYMTYNGQDGYQTWKISGGLNGGFSVIGDMVNLVNTLAQYIHEGTLANEILNDTRLFNFVLKGLSRLCLAFGAVVNFEELMKECPWELAAAIAALMTYISWLIGTYMLLILATASTLFVAIVLFILVTTLVSVIMTEFVNLVKSGCQAFTFRQRNKYHRGIAYHFHNQSDNRIHTEVA